MANYTCLQRQYTITAPSFLIGCGIRRIDEFMGELSSSHLYLFEGSFSAVQHMTTAVVVNAVQRFGQPVVIVDGGNSTDVYDMATWARRYSMVASQALDTIMVARAFTAHQLDSLIDQLSVFIAQYQPLVVTIQHITDLLSDTDIDPKESLQLLIRWQNTLRQLANAHNIIILVTTGQPKAPFSTVLHQNMDEVVQYDKQGLDVRISLLRQNQHIHYRPIPRHQMALDEFVEGKYG